MVSALDYGFVRCMIAAVFFPILGGGFMAAAGTGSPIPPSVLTFLGAICILIGMLFTVAVLVITFTRPMTENPPPRASPPK